MEDLDYLNFSQDPVVWSELKFDESDEDWSVSESSSDPGFFLDNFDDVNVSYGDIVPEEVCSSLCQLDLLPTEPVMPLPPTSWGHDQNIFGSCPTQIPQPLPVPMHSIKQERRVVTPTHRATPLNNAPQVAPYRRKRKASLIRTAGTVPTACEPVKMARREPHKCTGGHHHNNPVVSRAPAKSTPFAVVDPEARLAYDTSTKRSAKAGTRCEFCLETFDSGDALQAHRQKHIVGHHHYKCTFAGCQKHYATGEGLRLHVRNVHLCAKNWVCLAENCSRTFVRQSDLRMHIIRMHSNIRPYPCLVDSCQKSFACHSELRRHVHSCHKMPCPKPEKTNSKTNFVDPAFIQALMKKAD